MTTLLDEQKQQAMTFLRRMNDAVETMDSDGNLAEGQKFPVGLIPAKPIEFGVFVTMVYQDPLFKRICDRFTQKTGLRLTIVDGRGKVLLDSLHIQSGYTDMEAQDER